MAGDDEADDSNELDTTARKEDVRTTSDASSSPNPQPTPAGAVTHEELKKVKAELAKNLEEESMLLSLQMQLTVQLEELNKAVSTAETEERLANLALQQAKVARLLQSGGTDEDEEELVTVQVQS